MFGFSSAGYNIKIIKKFLFKELCRQDEPPSFTVKKAGKYPCIKSKSLKFLDILQFLAPGYNLKSFFKALMPMKKRVSSPMTILLLQNNLTRPHYHPMKLFTPPSKDVMFLKKTMKLFEQGKSEQEALQVLRLEEIPKTGPENYQWLNDLSNENGWSTGICTSK